jgi:hypothetical protein
MLLRHALAKPNARSSHRIPYAAGRRNRCNRGDLADRGRRDRRVRPERRAFPFGSFRRHRHQHHPTILLLNLASRATQFGVSLVRIIWRLGDFVGPYIDNRIAIDILDTEHDALRWTADDALQIVALRRKIMSFPGKRKHLRTLHQLATQAFLCPAPSRGMLLLKAQAFRRVATRFEKTARNYRAVTLSATKIR